MAKKESYENNLQKLKDILESLEENELSLEDGMKAYEDGVKLVNKLHKTLSTLEGKIAIIKDDEELEFNGENES